MAPSSETLPGLDERPITETDVRPIRSVLGHIKDDGPVGSAAKNIVYWLTAFDLFKSMERDFGLPVGTNSRLLYGALVAQLKGAGKMSLVMVDRFPQSMELLEMNRKDIECRLKELCWDDDWVDNPLTPEERKSLQAAFG